MDITSITTDDIKNMSEDEKREYIKELIHQSSNEQSGIQAAFLGPDGQQLTLKEITEHIGEEAVIEIMMKALSSDDDAFKCHAITKQDFNDLAIKARNGEELTKEEQAIFDTITNSMEDPLEFQKHILAVILEIVQYSQESVQYSPTLMDLSIIWHMLLMDTLAYQSEGRASLYQNAEILLETTSHMADDILDTWEKTLTSQPDEGMVILALATAIMQKVSKYETAHNHPLLLPPHSYLRERLSIPEDFFSDEDENNNETENGSNDNKKAASVTDAEMRNKLKE